MEEIFNWGQYPRVKSVVKKSNTDKELLEFVNTQDTLIARGNGRCYGDSGLQKAVFSTLLMNKALHFDVTKGVLKCEAGILLGDILKIIVPKGFFLPVTPGTKFVTLGGAIASNIHGKNHHKEGAFSRYVQSFVLVNEKAEKIKCSRTENAELFQNTMGSMGLTGIITEATISLKPIESSYIRLKSIKTKNLDETLDLLEEYQNFTYSVAWIDCLKKGSNFGRSILMLGEHAKFEELDFKKKKEPLKLSSNSQLNIPFNLPHFMLNYYSIGLFNALYYRKHLKPEIQKLVHFEPFFYPLDAIENWNKIYGKKGFLQYQFVLPFRKGKEGMNKILEMIVSSGTGSFLAVLKTFGKKDDYSSVLSFPMPGYTLALDFKINDKVFLLLDELDKIVTEYEGKIYLTKDARMSRSTFCDTYKDKYTHPGKFSSLQSQRLKI